MSAKRLCLRGKSKRMERIPFRSFRFFVIWAISQSETSATPAIIWLDVQIILFYRVIARLNLDRPMRMFRTYAKVGLARLCTGGIALW